MKNYLINHKKLFSLLVAIAFSIIISLFNSTFLSPIFIGIPYGSLNQDSQFFYYSASLLAKGNIPYIDFFDHKGLYHIYIDALGILMGGKIALFFIEFIFLSVGVYFALESMRMIKEDNKLGLLLVGLLALSLSIFRQSNGEGMWLLPFVSLIIYFFLLGKKKNKNYYLLSGLFIGIEMGLAINSRASDAIFAGVFALMFIAMLIKEKQIKLLIFTALTAIGSLAIIMTAFYIPAFQLGYAKEMFNDAIIHNFFYMSSTPLDVDIFISKGIAIVLLAISILFTVHIYKNKKNDQYSFMFAFTSIGVSLLYIVIGHYLAYFLSISIFIAIFLTYYLSKVLLKPKQEETKSVSSAGLGFCITIGMLVIDLVLCYGPINNIISYKEEQNLITNLAIIKQEQKDKENLNVYAVDLTTSIYIEENIDTHFNIFANQSWWSYADPSIKEKVGVRLNEGIYDYIFLGYGNCRDYFLEKMEGVYSVYKPSGYIESTQYQLFKKI